jgi:hypothetical protein
MVCFTVPLREAVLAGVTLCFSKATMGCSRTLDFESGVRRLKERLPKLCFDALKMASIEASATMLYEAIRSRHGCLRARSKTEKQFCRR